MDRINQRTVAEKLGAWRRETLWEPVRRMLCAILLALPRVITRGRDKRPRP